MGRLRGKKFSKASEINDIKAAELKQLFQYRLRLRVSLSLSVWPG